jgi:hypothetical protein
MIKVQLIRGMNGFFVHVFINGEVRREYGPFTYEESKAFMMGAREFAQPFVTTFEDYE